MSENFRKELFAGLKNLAESAFPKQCANCGKTYQTAEEFLAETKSISKDKTGLKQTSDDDGTTIVEAFRNCHCGSTLMDFFSDRRDLSERGLKRRQRFGELMDFLVENGMEQSLARTELLKVMRGQKSEVLDKIKPPK